MIASYRAEVLKTRKRVANWILVVIMLGLLLLLGYLTTYLVLKNPPRRFESPIPASVLIREDFPENLLPNVLSWTASFGAAIMLIFGALSTASEYGWLTIQTELVQRPGRIAVLAGKMLNLAIVTILVAILVLGSAALMSEVLVTADGASSSFASWSTLAKGFGALVLELSVWMGFGMFLGIALRSTAGAIGGGLVYLFVGEDILARVFQNTDYIKDVLKFLPGINASGINAAFPLNFRNPNAAAPLVSAGRGTVTLIVWLIVFVFFSFVIFRARDVTGA